MRICIAGDLCITRQYAQRNLVGENLIALFANADFGILNLEGPITDAVETKIVKTGPHLLGTETCLAVTKQLNVGVLTLANNHSMDYGWQGLSDTLDACARNKLLTVGAGANLAEASQPLFVEQDGCRLAIVNFAENEWASAATDSPGANPYDLIACARQIKSATQQADHVLVVIHGGHEHHNLPSPRRVKEYRFFAESGASAIIAHHTHRISGYEVHNGVPIFYGLGNFLFTKPSRYPSWYSGLCVRLVFARQQPVDFELFPVTQTQDDFKVDMARDAQQTTMISEVAHLSTVIGNDVALQRHWEAFVLDKQRNYVNLLNPIHIAQLRLFYLVLRKLGLERLFWNRGYLRQILNAVRCESHADLLKAALRSELM